MNPINNRRLSVHSLLLVTSTLGLIIFVANATFERQIRDTSLKQAEIIANMLNYGSQTLYRDEDLQRLVSTLSGEVNVESIYIFTSKPPLAIAASSRRWMGVSLHKIPFQPELIQNIEHSLNLRSAEFLLDSNTRQAYYFSPILLTQAIVYGKGAGLTPATAVIQLDLRVIHNRYLTLGFAWVTVVIVAMSVTGFALFNLHRKRVQRVVRSIIASIKQPGDGSGTSDAAVQIPEVKELTAELKRTFEALRKSEQRLRFSLEAGEIWSCEVSLADGKIAWSEGRSLMISQEAAGVSWNTLEDIYRIIHPEDRSFVKGQLAEFIGNGQDLALEFRIAGHEGKFRWISCRGTVTTRQGHKFLTLVGIDITRRKRFETTIALQQANLLATSKMSALGEMAAGMAHEINNPLAIIDGRAKQLKILLSREPIAKEAVVSALDSMSYMIMRIAKIIRGLRTFSRDSRADPFEMARIKNIVDETLALCTERFKVNGVQLEVESISPDLALECRPTEISQVLLNLLSNAFDAVSSLADRWIRIAAVQSDHTIEISVMDSGNGIPLPVRQKLAQPFFTTKDVGKGTGLGLSVSKGIVEAHNGSLWYDEKSKHTRFVIRLPISQAGGDKVGDYAF
jgi:C4-dicarboxylate-specific signal transduction histidine kinase